MTFVVIVFAVAVVGGVVGGFCSSLGFVAWEAVEQTHSYRRVHTAWLGWQARRRHRRSGRS